MFHLSESRTSKRLGPKQLPFYSNPEKGPESEENDPPPRCQKAGYGPIVYGTKVKYITLLVVLASGGACIR